MKKVQNDLSTALEDVEQVKERSLLSSIEANTVAEGHYSVNLEAIIAKELEVLLQGIDKVYENLILPAKSLAQTLKSSSKDSFDSSTKGTSIPESVIQKLEAIKGLVTNLIDSRRITKVDTVESSVLKLPDQEAHWDSGKNSDPGFAEEGVTNTLSQRHFLKQLVRYLIEEGSFNAAFCAALNEKDDEVVLWICSKVPEKLFLDPVIMARLLKRVCNSSFAKPVY